MQQRLRERWESFTKEQRLSVVLLSVCGFFAIGLSMYQMRMHVRDPFLTDRESAIAFKKSLTLSPDQEEAKQKRTDSDGDGLSDWDEVNVYRLNPGLKDTCGDGFLDNVRVATGKHLVCTTSPGVIDVSGLNSASSTYTELQQSVVAGSADVMTQALGSTVGASGGADATSGGTQTIPRDPTAIREALRGQVDAAKLDAVSDDQLLQYYDQALAQQQAATSTVVGTP